MKLAGKFGELVQEQYATVGQGNFAGARLAPTANEACVRDRMVRSAEGAGMH
jgi:hypothetical protein